MGAKGTHTVDTTKRLAALRELMASKEHDVQAFVVPSEDQRCAVVTLKEAFLFTDGRYFLQAEKQLDKNWTLMKQGLPDVPTWQDFLSKNLEASTRIGIDPAVISAMDAQVIEKALEPRGSKLVPLEKNIVDAVWTDRPPRPQNPVIHLDEKYSGQSPSEKVKALREELAKKKHQAFVVNMLDEVAWLFNLRGSDIDYNPVFFAYAVVSVDSVELFVEKTQLGADTLEYLAGNVNIQPYNAFFDYLKQLPNNLVLNEEQKVLIGDKSSLAIAHALGKDKYVVAPSPIADLKAIKNSTEIEGFRQSHIRDGAALARYFAWLEEQLENGVELNESQGADQLEKFRSFTCVIPEHFGTPNDEEKRAFTRVLQGHVAIDTAVFPSGTTGFVIDSWARRALWQDGLDYRHGTGHGVGHYLNVHEGPHGIGVRIVAYNNTPLKVGMTVSNEPGYYADGRFGIRIESIVLVREVKTPNNFGDKGYLGFEHVTLCPIQKNLVDTELLTKGERKWLNDYHAETWAKVSPLLANDERALNWLKRQCAPL
ncbi:hypothetical protein H0H81_007977 [Sphagnurus paluster]|uniref:Creatinase/aminopeptidase n=1 Tax=Sphagnurus paluster TaxID=117069 RepID=A0A9P7GKU2_9AGAR|nr:hypothetical protein H0H81_007977 [Sphagnurus paluster]